MFTRQAHRLAVILAFLAAASGAWRGSTQAAIGSETSTASRQVRGSASLQETGLLIVGYRSGTGAAQRDALHHALGASVVARLPQIGAEVVRPDDAERNGVEGGPPWVMQDGAGAIASARTALITAYEASALVRYVEADHELRVADPVEPHSSGIKLPSGRLSPDLHPDDPLFDQQWMHKTIHTSEAWDRVRADAETIAIVDTGVDCSHPDLMSVCGQGYDFVNGDADAEDDHGHGTAVAGIAAAAVNNGLGIAGVARGAKIMPVKVLGANGAGGSAAIAQGITWAVDHGAKVVNLSLGGAFKSTVLEEAMAYARAQGVVVVAAIGGENTSNPSYPAAYPNVIGVASTTPSDDKASFSSFGMACDLSAPGVQLLTTLRKGSYASYSGTSFSAAIVSGLAALIKARTPSRTPEEIERVLEESAVDLGTAGWDPLFGAGRVDALAALIRDDAIPTTIPTSAPPVHPTPPSSACSPHTVRIWGFPDTVGTAGPGSACTGCDGVFTAGDRMAGAACPLGPLTVELADAADPSRVYWRGELTPGVTGAVDLRAVINVCEPPPYRVTLITTSTTCYQLCPTARAERVLTQNDFDQASWVAPGSGQGRSIEVRWFFWQCRR